MCGIAGIFNLNRAVINRAILTNMVQSIAHRGPDGAGEFVEDNIALGHRRLSILDLSERGSQPMSSHDNNWVVVFNGCVYNFQTLRQQLKSCGHTFFSSTDTEVITEGLSEFGPTFFERLDGMFAVAAWNRKEETLYLSRDRFGIKPLYYYFNGKTLVFASEVKAILEHPDYSISIDYDALNQYFTFQNVFTYNTLFKGVNMLPPANTIKINKYSSKINHHSWWDYNFNNPDNTMTEQDAKLETQRLFVNAVTKQMISDVPVGAYLSGGMDSGSIAAIASKQVKRLLTFTAGFDMSEVTGVEINFDERRDAEIMANAFKTEHYEQVINAGDLSWSLPRLVYHLEDLRVGMSYPNFYISRLASKFVKVCLQGTGGDELYGGYPWRYYRVFKSLDKKEFFDNYYGFWQRLVSDHDKQTLFNDIVTQNIDIHSPRKIFEKVFTFNDGLRYNTPEEHIQNSLYFEIKTFLPGVLLVGDKLSMASGLEERFPFLDNELVEFSQRIPIRYKLGNLETYKKLNENIIGNKKAAFRQFDDGKNVLRKAMEDFLPSSIINRKKQGFSAPDESWYRGENANYIKKLLLNKKTVSTEFINPYYMKQIINEHIDQKINHRLLLWSFMSFEWWCKIFLNNEKNFLD